MVIKNILYKIIKLTKRLFFIKRLVAVVVLLFGVYELGSDVVYSSQYKEVVILSANQLESKTELPKYIKLKDFKIDCKYPFQVNKLFKKKKTPQYFYLPLVSSQNPKEIIALIQDNKPNNINEYQNKEYCLSLNPSEQYFKISVESKLIHGEKEFYIENGFTFSNSIFQLDIDTPPQNTNRYIIGTLVCVILLIFLLLSFLPKKILNVWFDQYTGIDYTFGVKLIKKIIKQVEAKQYESAMENLKSLTADERTQAIDALALMLSEKTIKEWSKQDRNSNLLKIIKGSRLVYDAWEARGYAFAEDTSYESVLSFNRLLEQAVPVLNQVQGLLKVDAQHLLIRVYKGLSRQEDCKRAFEYVISAESKHTMAHMAYLDVILPKWFGSREEVELFISTHKSKSKLLEYILEAKKAMEFDKEASENSIEYSSKYIDIYETEISNFKSKNPNRFVLFNYLYFFAHDLNNKKLIKRYDKKLNDYLSPTLYTPLRSDKEIKEKLG